MAFQPVSFSFISREVAASIQAQGLKGLIDRPGRRATVKVRLGK